MPEPASAPAESTARDAPAYRLVIRAQIVSEPISDVPTEPNTNTRALALAAAAVVLLLGLGWIGFSMFSADPAPRPVVSNTPAPAVVPARVPPPQSAPIETESPLQPIDQVMPTPSASALATVRGTIRVAIRVTIDKQGRVVDAAAAESGPSKYFERLAREASRQWTFTPTSHDAGRTALLRFQFTRNGATANADVSAP